MTFAACPQLTASIRLPVFVDQDRDTIKLPTALIPKISSPYLRKIELASNGALSTQEAVDFSRDTWGAVENPTVGADSEKRECHPFGRVVP